ncbi:hypothetical protein HDU85_006819 [Gaertneriomyces sp. JEL0708]|nr:hypothetical protein HDU85_006819 [Gaertneriomyces sp. JEL0708]
MPPPSASDSVLIPHPAEPPAFPLPTTSLQPPSFAPRSCSEPSSSSTTTTTVEANDQSIRSFSERPASASGADVKPKSSALSQMIRLEAICSSTGPGICTISRCMDSPTTAGPISPWEALSKAIEKELSHSKGKALPASPQQRYLPDPSHSDIKTELSSIQHAIDTHHNNKRVVLKRLNDDNDAANHELVILQKIKENNLPYVLKLHDTFIDENGSRVLVFPQYQRFECDKLDLVDVAKYTRQLVTGLKAAHDLGIAHLDVTICNLMLDDNRNLVIIDWGLARICKPGESHPIGRGTPGYIAPEMFLGSATDGSPDIYSAGIVLGQWLKPYLLDCSLDYLGSKLVRGSTTSFITRSIQDHLDSQKIGYETPWCPVLTSAAELLCQMLENEPSMRITAREILQSDFLNAREGEFGGMDYGSWCGEYLKVSICGSPRDRPKVVIRDR